MTQPTVDTPVENKNRRNNRMVIIALFGLFVAPVILAYVAHYMNWYSVASKNKGELLEAPYPHFEGFAWFDEQNQPLHFKDFETQVWWVYLPSSNQCDAVCEANMRLLTQTHAGLGKDAEKVTRLIVFPSEITAENQQKVENPEQIRLAHGGGLATKNDKTSAEQSLDLEVGGLYLMDAHGNIFMRYVAATNDQEAKERSRDLREDVRRLIKNTGI